MPAISTPRLKRTGHFWQGRFGCVAMDEAHLGAAMRYVALNPVRARLADAVTDWPWSNVHAQLGTVAGDGLTAVERVRGLFPDFAAMLAAGEDAAMAQRLRRAETIGRPIGDEAFLGAREKASSRALAPAKRSPKPKISGVAP